MNHLEKYLAVVFAVFLTMLCSPNISYAQKVSSKVNDVAAPWGNPTVFAENRVNMGATMEIYGLKKISLHGLWKFDFVENSDMRPKDFYRCDYDDKGWGTMTVPGMWELNGYGDPIYLNAGYPWKTHFKSNPPFVPVDANHVGSYRKTFEIPQAWLSEDKEVFVHFGSVTSNIILYVNGKYVGYSEDSKLETVFNVTDFLKAGENLFAFQVFRWCDGTYLEDQDFWRLSGLARESYLYLRDKERIETIEAIPELDSKYKNAVLSIRGVATEALRRNDGQAGTGWNY